MRARSRTSTTDADQESGPTPNVREVAHIDLAGGRVIGARGIIREMGRLARKLPDRVAVVVVSVTSVDALTVELLTGLAISRRLLAMEDRSLVLRVPGVPTTAGAAALLGTMPFVVATDSRSGW